VTGALNSSGKLFQRIILYKLLSSLSSQLISGRLRLGRSVFDSRKGHEIFLFSAASRPAPGSTQLPIRWVPGSPSSGVKGQGHKTDHSPSPSADSAGSV
jgi:hypothetical protein